MKLLKKSVSLLLVLCMLLSYVPGTVFAASENGTNFATKDGFYSILHLDAGRKYFSPEVVKKFIDDMAAQGFNQLELYLADNQGFRLMLDTTTVTTEYGTYDLTGNIGMGIVTEWEGTDAYYPSEDEPGYWDETQMEEIIAYANSKGIEIVPTINMPGHMAALLQGRPSTWLVDNGTETTMDVNNAEAVAYALAVLELYTDYFEDQGIKYFSVGADEWCADVFGAQGAANAPKTQVCQFLNQCAAVIKSHNMIPRAFSDLFDSNGTVDHDFEVYDWQNKGQELVNNYRVINTSDTWYWVMNNPGGYQHERDELGYVDVDATYEPVGAMMCIWCDIANLDGADSGEGVYDRSKPAVAYFSNTLREQGYIVAEANYTLKVGETADVSFTLTGEYTAAQIAEQYGFGSVLAADVTVTPATGGGADTSSALTALTVGTKVLLGDGTNFLVNNNGTLSVGTAANATQWDVVAHEGSFDFMSNGKYLTVSNDGAASLGASAPSVPFTIKNGVVQHAWWPDQQVNVSGVSGAAKAYSVSSGTPASTTFTFKGAAVGNVTFEGPDGIEYHVTVVSDVHTCDSNIPATCNKGNSCSQCGEAQDNERNYSNHAGGTELRGYVAATTTSTGYTGDTYCKGCNNKIDDGDTIPMIVAPVEVSCSCADHTVKVTANNLTELVCAGAQVDVVAVDGAAHTVAYTLTPKNVSGNYTGEATVSVPVPSGWDTDKIFAFVVNANNSVTTIQATVADGRVTYTCPHFSVTGVALEIASDYSATIDYSITTTATFSDIDGQLAANNTTGSTAKGLANYTVTVTEIPATGGSYPDFVDNVAAGAYLNYEKGAYVVYEGKVYECIGQVGNWYKPTDSGILNVYWVLRDDLSATGGGTPTYKTTVTFTATGINGVDTVEIGGKVFKITVINGSDPIVGGDTTCEHTWSTEYSKDADSHWIECTKCGGKKNVTSHSGGTANCQTKAQCSVCGETYGDYGDHVLSQTATGTAEGHYYTCTVDNCGHHTATESHTGGTANCVDGAFCSSCGYEYTDVDSANHKENDAEHKDYVVGAQAPTADQAGSTGATHCGWCDQVKKNAEEIPALGESDASVTVLVGSTATLELDGHIGTNGANGQIPNGYATYTVVQTGAYVDETNVTDWVSGTQYEQYAMVRYNGKIWRAKFWTNAVPGDVNRNEWEEVLPPKTTITFTGVARGADTLTIGETTISVTVECPHEWEQKHDANNHWNQCIKCGETKDLQEHTGGTATCMDQAVCSVCNTAYGSLNANNHVWGTEYSHDNEGHWLTCINPACNGAASAKEAHGETTLVNVVAPSLEAPGYSGDTACADCGHILANGDEVPKLTEDQAQISEITLFLGATDTIVVDNGNLQEKVVENEYVKFEVVNIPAKEASGPDQATSNASVLASDFVIVGNGTYYIKVVNGTLTTTTNPVEAARFIPEEHDDGFQLTYMVGDTKYYFTGYNGTNTQVRFVPEASADLVHHPGWTVGTNNLLTEAFWSNGQMLINNGSISTIGGNTGTAGTGNAYAYTYTSATEGSSEIRIEAKAVTPENEPFVAFSGDTKYLITVEPETLEDKSVVVEFFQTNAQVTANGATSYTITADMGGWNADTHLYDTVYSKDGIAIDEINQKKVDGKYVKDSETFPYFGTSSRGQEVAYGMGMRLDSAHHQEPWVNDDVADRSGDGDEFYYIRYWGGEWAVSDFDRTDWKPLNSGDQLVAYYLQHTKVTDENIVSTYVMDWGDMYNVFASSDGTRWGVLDLAVKFEGGVRDPELDAFTVNGKSAFYHNIPTWSSAGGVDLVQPYTDANGNTVNGRTVRTVEGLETGQYEIYMITLTRTSDVITDRIPYETPAQVGAAGTDAYDYNGTEWVVWLETEDTVFDATAVVGPGAKNEAGVTNPFTCTYGSDTWGAPSIDGVVIYEHQGVLLTYYVRAIEHDDNLKVFYRVNDGIENEDGIPGTPIYNYDIVVDNEFFDPDFDVDSSDRTGLTNNEVTNIGGTTEEVTSRLTDLLAVPPEYRIGGYEFTQEILYGVVTGENDDGSDIIEYFKKNELPTDPNIKHVVLYYDVQATHHYVPVDFGVPLEIDDDLFHFDDLVDAATETFTVNSITIQNENATLKYGAMSYVNVEGSLEFSLRYTPNKVMQGPENPIKFVINVTVRDKATGAEKTTKDIIHGVVFLPATTVYYEESFAVASDDSQWSGVKPVMANEDPQDTNCYSKQNYNYGYDPYYAGYIDSSHGSYADSNVRGAYKQFTFTGTGVEIYANCTNATGLAIVTILKDSQLIKTYIVDTRMLPGTSGSTSKQSNLFAYNVPIVSELGLDYGTYTVKVASIKSGDPLRNGQPIFFDGFRVYNTLLSEDTVHETTAGVIYQANGENNPKYAQLRDAVLNALNVNTDGKNTVYANSIAKHAMAQVYDKYGEGEAVYGLIVSPGYSYTDIEVDEDATEEEKKQFQETYDAILKDLLDNGPKNEIYLWGQDSVTFSFDATKHNIQIGLKALNKAGDADKTYNVKVNATVLDSNGNTVGSIKVPTNENGFFVTSTDMYYPVTLTSVPEDGKVTVTIQNSANDYGVLAITRVKFVEKPVAKFKMMRAAAPTSDSLFLPLTEQSLTFALRSIGYQMPDKMGLTFDEDGEIRYYEDGEPIYAGVVQDDDGNFYYINSTKKAVKNCAYTIGASRTNGLIDPGTYQIDADGKLIIVEEDDTQTADGLRVDADGQIRYYVDGEATYAGVVKDSEGNLYYINSSKKAVKNCTYTIGASRTNGLVDAGTYQFDADGKMVIEEVEDTTKNGLIKDEDGQIRYYVNGEATYAGVVEDAEGNLYYINSTKKAVKDCTYSIGASRTNGLVDAGTYRFDADGKMILE